MFCIDEEDVEETIDKDEVTVGKSPYFETELQTETVWEEEETTICLFVKVKGTPKPKTRWYESGIEITPNEEFKIEEYDEGVSMLTIKKRPTESVREITCEATNEHGTVTTRTLVIPGNFGYFKTHGFRLGFFFDMCVLSTYIHIYIHSLFCFSVLTDVIFAIFPIDSYFVNYYLAHSHIYKLTHINTRRIVTPLKMLFKPNMIFS